MIWFKIQLELLGVSKAYANEAVRDLQNELKLRTHLKNPIVLWEDENQRIIVHVDTESLMDEEVADKMAEEAGDQMAEELLEAAVGALVLPEFNYIKVNVLAVEY